MHCSGTHRTLRFAGPPDLNSKNNPNIILLERISQYFEQKPLEFPFHDADSEINFQNILRKHQVQSDFIYDNSWIDDSTSIAKLSLKTTLDYTRRLITVKELKMPCLIFIFFLETLFSR